MIKLSGILQYSMGGFLCLRGFASFKLLSAVSEPNPEVQRELIETHRGEMADFLNAGEYRFFPEVILSLHLTDGTKDFEILESFHASLSAGQTWNKNVGNIHFSTSQNVTKNTTNTYDPLPRLERMNLTHIRFDEKTNRLTRIDGNHRLSVADEIADDFSVPYCLLLFRTPTENEQYARAIFHNINAKQIPLKLEENLRVILGSPAVFSDDKLKSDPSFGWEYYLARKTLERVDLTYFPAIIAYIGNEKNTFFVELYKWLLRNNELQAEDASVDIIRTQLVDIESALVDSGTFASSANIAIIGAMAYYKLTDPFKYRGFLKWVKKNHIGNVSQLHMDDVIKLYDEIYEHIPKKAFLARWYPAQTDPEYTRSLHRVNAIKKVARELNLELTDLGTQTAEAFDIREVMYHDIRDCDIFIADLTGARPNVMVEVGYALRYVDTGRMVFYFQETDSAKKVPFDVNHFSYDKISDSAEIESKTKARIEAILAKAYNGAV